MTVCGFVWAMIPHTQMTKKGLSIGTWNKEIPIQILRHTLMSTTTTVCRFVWVVIPHTPKQTKRQPMIFFSLTD